jgi:hypothetical protein
MEEILSRQNSTAISCQVSPASLLDVSAGYRQSALVDKLRMKEIRWGRTIDHKWSLRKGAPTA